LKRRGLSRDGLVVVLTELIHSKQLERGGKTLILRRVIIE